MASFKYSNGMLFNPNDNDLVEKLSVYGEFSKNETDYGLDRLKLFRYIIMMYDMLSPMRLEYPDFWERKKISALNAGFKVNKKGYEYMAAVKEADCIKCRLCEKTCPDLAIYIEKD